MLNTFPRWKYFLLVISLLVGLIYALPNLYGEEPVIQIKAMANHSLDESINKQLDTLLHEQHLVFNKITQNDNELIIHFKDTQHQLKAKDLIQETLGENYSIALNLLPLTPAWLNALYAHPMKLGLDLRGGVYFLMDVDVNSKINQQLDSYFTEIRKKLVKAKIHYKAIAKEVNNNAVVLSLETEDTLNQTLKSLQKDFPGFIFNKELNSNQYKLLIKMDPQFVQTIRQETVEQTASTLRNRINELGVSEAIVQRQGLNRMVVELPGVQDINRAKEILGKTATLEFLLSDDKANFEEVAKGHIPMGSKLYRDKRNNPILLKKQVILTGNTINRATTGYDKDNQPIVQVQLDSSNPESKTFAKVTENNVGRALAVVYIETKPIEKIVNNEKIKELKKIERVISLANIREPLGNSFQISGFTHEEARDLALLLRSGAMPATVSIIEERIIGPSMGQENINKGIISASIGLGLVLIFMVIYYGTAGLIANVALVANLILLLALLSIIGATLTLPGIAGIVLTLGMAVDANVLIFERIREELRLGASHQSSIYKGYEYAFSTILDSNLTTLIVGIILFVIGTGPIKGFAITLSLGLLTSIFTAVTGSRAIVNLFYGGNSKRKLNVGI